ncbi:hypothetical protein BH23PLA1_BH23PLA1_17670 [soil metagenome]
MTTPGTPIATLPTGGVTSRTVAVRTIMVLLIIGAAHLLSVVLVPILLALVLAITLSGVANRLERWGLTRTVSSLVCTLGIGAILTTVGGLLIYQLGSIVRDADTYINELSSMLAEANEYVGNDRIRETLGVLQSVLPDQDDDEQEQASESHRLSLRSERSGDDEEPDLPDLQVPESLSRDEDADGETVPGNEPDDQDNSPDAWAEFLQAHLRWVVEWLVMGLGGLLGLALGLFAFLIALFFMLKTRDRWIRRLERAARRIGLEPKPEILEGLRRNIVTFLGCLSMIALTYVIVISLALWLIGVPRPLFWGLLTGMLEFIPIIGPLTSGVLATVASLATGSFWKPLAVAAIYIGLHAFEGYVVWPLLFGRTIRFNQVVILFSILFFGLLLGPLGPILAMPMMILVRGLVAISTDTPALDALLGVKEPKTG